MTFGKHEWKRRIRHELEAPAKVVIISYAESGYSKRLTAAAKGLDHLRITTEGINGGFIHKIYSEEI
jgi:glycogen synthase